MPQASARAHVADEEPSADFLCQPYEQAFRSTDVAEPICIFVLDDFSAYELSAVLDESCQRAVDVIHSEHDT